jgi:hypothetical protein
MRTSLASQGRRRRVLQLTLASEQTDWLRIAVMTALLGVEAKLMVYRLVPIRSALPDRPAQTEWARPGYWEPCARPAA